MVFGAIINWTVGKTLDLTFDTIWWITKKTGQGIFYAGQYLIIRKNKDNNTIENNTIENNTIENNTIENNKNDELISLIKEQNKLLNEEIILLQNKISETEETEDKD